MYTSFVAIQTESSEISKRTRADTVEYKASVELQMHYCTPCSDAISGPKNRVFKMKNGHNFYR